MRKLKKLKRLFDSNKAKWTTLVLKKYNYNINADESVAATRSIEVENSSLEKNKVVKTINKKQELGLLIYKDAIELSVEHPIWYELPVQAGQILVVKAASQYLNLESITDRKAVLMINSYDDNGKEVDIPCGQMVKSENLHSYFKYLPSTNNNIKELHSFVVPNDVSYIQLGLSAFNTVEEQKVFIRSLSIKPKLDDSQSTKFIDLNVLDKEVDSTIEKSNNQDTVNDAEKLKNTADTSKTNRNNVTPNSKELANKDFFQKANNKIQFGLLVCEDAIELSEKYPTWYEISVQAGQTLVVKAASQYSNMKNIVDRKAVLMINSYDDHGKKIDVPCGKMAKSENLNTYFKYLPSTNNNVKELHSFVVPDGVSQIHLGLRAFNISKEQQVFLKNLSIEEKLKTLQDVNITNLTTSKKKLESTTEQANDQKYSALNDRKLENEISSKRTDIKKSQFGLLIYKDAVQLPKESSIWYELPVQAGQILIISAASQYLNMKNIVDRKAVLMINSYNEDGEEVDVPCGRMAKSKVLNAYFKYLPSTNNNIKELHSFVVPDGVSQIHLGLCAFNTSKEQKVFVKSLSVEPKLDTSQTNRCHSPDSQSVEFKVVNRSEILINNQPFIDELSITGNKKYEIANFKISESADTLEILAVSLYRLKNNIISRKAVVLLDFLDAKNNRILDVSGIGFSTLFNQFFRYLNNNCESIEQDLESIVKIKIPDGVVSVNLTIASMSLKADEQIDIRFQIQGYSEIEEKKAILQNLELQLLPNPITFDPYNKRYTSDLTIASILDEFTTECLFHEVELIQVTQENWQSQLENITPDFLLVESCWRGNDNNWGTLTKGSSGGKKLSPLLQYCKRNNIPTVFWNKEDPPHYEKFGAIARLFDVAITTDINMVDRYKADFGIDVYPLSFAAQPKIHNPAPTIPRLNKAVFAGSYYRDKYKRCADFDEIMSQVKKASVDYDIFDRNYHNDIENFIYPDHYQDHIIGNLPAEDVWKAHKGYKYQVNMNTVQDSSTMFARRVYESLASGTPVISNDSVGVQQLFGDLVIMPNKKQSITQQLRDLESSHLIYEDRVRRGVRRVMREHTYGHRIQQICKLLGIDVEVAVPNAKLAITVNSEDEITRAKSIFDTQTASAKQLFIELENFDNAHQFLNKSNSTISYTMKLGRNFYSDDNQYYGTEKVLKCNVNDSLPVEALEDFIYWGNV